jgi:Predicted AAA-ATPase
MKPNLPISQQYFRDIRENNNLYIDKTQFIYDLCIQKSKNYFLSRPRRFGKSLTVDTIAELFKGYLTIKEVLQESPMHERTFILKHPNQEVKQAFNRFLLKTL